MGALVAASTHIPCDATGATNGVETVSGGSKGDRTQARSFQRPYASLGRNDSAKYRAAVVPSAASCVFELQSPTTLTADLNGARQSCAPWGVLTLRTPGTCHGSALLNDDLKPSRARARYAASHAGRVAVVRETVECGIRRPLRVRSRLRQAPARRCTGHEVDCERATAPTRPQAASAADPRQLTTLNGRAGHGRLQSLPRLQTGSLASSSRINRASLRQRQYWQTPAEAAQQKTEPRLAVPSCHGHNTRL